VHASSSLIAECQGNRVAYHRWNQHQI